MGSAFSGPGAFKFLGFKPKATAVLQATPVLLVVLILVLLSLAGILLLTLYIHLVTSRPYQKPKPVERVKN